jgi:hypothetical protein
VLDGLPRARRRAIEETLGGLRFVRNRMGHHLDPDDLIQPVGGRITAWTWKPVPEPALASLPPRGQAWEMTRYRAYQAHLAGRTVGDTFGRAAVFLELATDRAKLASPAMPLPQSISL